MCGLRAGNLVRLHVLQETPSLKEPPLQRRIHHRGVTGCWRIVLHQLRHVRLDLVAAYRELFSESEHVGREPLAKNLPRLKRLDPFECLGVVEIVVHYVQSMHHDRDCDVVDREGHAELHALVCILNVGWTDRSLIETKPHNKSSYFTACRPSRTRRWPPRNVIKMKAPTHAGRLLMQD